MQQLAGPQVIVVVPSITTEEFPVYEVLFRRSDQDWGRKVRASLRHYVTEALAGKTLKADEIVAALRPVVQRFCNEDGADPVAIVMTIIGQLRKVMKNQRAAEAVAKMNKLTNRVKRRLP